MVNSCNRQKMYHVKCRPIATIDKIPAADVRTKNRNKQKQNLTLVSMCASVSTGKRDRSP